MTDSSDRSPPQLRRRDLFPSPVWSGPLPTLAASRPEMLEYVLTMRERDPGLKRSNVLGWHSPDQLHREPLFRPLADLVEALVGTEIANDLALDVVAERYRVRAMWAIVNPTHAHNHLHRHPGYLFSGVYYLQVPGQAGSLNFHDPRADVRMLRPRFAADTTFTNFLVRIQPEPGLLVLFPSWLPHNVDPNLSPEPRVAISFDIAGEAAA